MTTNEEIVQQDLAFVSPGTRIPFLPLIPERGSGAELVDHDGNRFLDFHSMACIMNVGYGHPKVLEAINHQSRKLLHCNPGYGHSEPMAVLAERLVDLTPGNFAKKVAFGLSGADANDGALKLVRAATQRPKAISFFGSYHGNTYGALSLSAVSLAMRRGFGPVVPDIHHIPFPDTYRPPLDASSADPANVCLEALNRLFNTVAPPDEVAAVFIEPIQGDSGIIRPPQSFIDGLREICREHGILIVAEEVQTGIGRTGQWFASELFDLEPDILLSSKALASGLPLSAIIARADLMDAWSSPGHVFSTGANPVCCAAALATIEVIRDEGLLENARKIGGLLKSTFEEMAQQYELIGDVRGSGLMIGVDLVSDRETRRRAKLQAAKVLLHAYRSGLYLTFLAGSVLRIAPPLVISEAQAERAITILSEGIEAATVGSISDEEASAITGW